MRSGKHIVENTLWLEKRTASSLRMMNLENHAIKLPILPLPATEDIHFLRPTNKLPLEGGRCNLIFNKKEKLNVLISRIHKI